jgi:tetratricopeptide (TPR) repeat protein
MRPSGWWTKNRGKLNVIATRVLLGQMHNCRKGTARIGHRFGISAKPCMQPGSARYVYVYAVALNSHGETRRAIELLEQTHARHPYDRDILIALVSMNQAMGDVKKAVAYAGKLVKINPRYGSVDQVIKQSSSH